MIPARQAKFFLLFLTAICMGIAVWGHLLATHGTFFDAVYLSIQMVLVNLSLEDTQANWQLRSMRFALPLLAASAVVLAAMLLVGRFLQFFSLRFAPATIVFLGAGRKASGIARSCFANHAGNEYQFRRAIAIDLDIDQEHARSLAEMGVRLIEADATNSNILRKLRLEEVSTIYITTGDDQRNIDVAREVILVSGGSSEQTIVICVSNGTLLRVAASDPGFLDPSKRKRLVWLDVIANAARIVSLRYPPDRYLGPGTEQSPIHVGIVGFGALGQAILLQSVRNCVLPGNTRIKITVFSNSRPEFDAFLRCHPVLDKGKNGDPMYRGFAPLADIEHVEQGSDWPAPSSLRDAAKTAPFCIFYVASENDYLAMVAGYQVSQAVTALGMSSQIVCCLPGTRFGTTAEAEVITSASAKAYEGVAIFHAMSDLFNWPESYPGETVDGAGMIVNEAYAYLAGHDWLPVPLDQSWRDPDKHKRIDLWLGLIEEFRWSSRYSADHVAVKLRAIGFDLCEGDNKDTEHDGLDHELAAAIEANLEMLMKMEHRRFVIERLLDGWLYSDPTAKPKRLNSTLVPYDDLPSKEKRKDESIVNSIPAIVSELLKSPKDNPATARAIRLTRIH